MIKNLFVMFHLFNNHLMPHHEKLVEKNDEQHFSKSNVCLQIIDKSM